jgi:hypothetical protein
MSQQIDNSMQYYEDDSANSTKCYENDSNIGADSLCWKYIDLRRQQDIAIDNLLISFGNQLKSNVKPSLPFYRMMLWYAEQITKTVKAIQAIVNTFDSDNEKLISMVVKHSNSFSCNRVKPTCGCSSLWLHYNNPLFDALDEKINKPDARFTFICERLTTIAGMFKSLARRPHEFDNLPVLAYEYLEKKSPSPAYYITEDNVLISTIRAIMLAMEKMITTVSRSITFKEKLMSMSASFVNMAIGSEFVRDLSFEHEGHTFELKFEDIIPMQMQKSGCCCTNVSAYMNGRLVAFFNINEFIGTTENNVRSVKDIAEVLGYVYNQEVKNLE